MAEHLSGEGSVSCHVPQQTTHRPPDFVSAYQQGLLKEFFQLPSGATAAALALPRNTKRAELVAALKGYAGRVGAPAAVLANIDKLAHPHARAVVTGQQAGLLLGPTYTMSKAATAVILARQLDTPERPVVPIFWLATQDHDADEVDHTYLLDGSESLHRVAVGLPPGVPVGRAPFEPAMLAAVTQTLRELEPRPRFLDEVELLLGESGGLARTYGDWFAAILMRFLGEAGLIPLDPLEPDLARLAGDVLRAEIAAPELSSEAINAAGVRLKKLGYEPQLGRGVNATNLFIELIKDGSTKRVLLRHRGGVFTADGEKFSASDLVARLDDDPSCITPAAGLRPVTQDAMLPTALFVLGPGELKYVAQLRGVYELHQVAMPLAHPRASVTVLEPAAVRLLSRFGLNAADFARDPSGQLERILLERHHYAGNFSIATDELESTFTKLLHDVEQIDVTLMGTVRKGHKHLEATLARLRDKSAAALSKRDVTTSRQFERLSAHLLPLGQPAERTLSPFSHVLKFGLEPLVERFLALEPSGAQVVEL